MSKPDLNKNGKPRKHGDTERQTFRLHKGVIADAKKLSEETGIPLSKLYRDLVTHAMRDVQHDGSVPRAINAQRSKETSIMIDEKAIAFTQELQKMRNALNQLGNNLNQDIRMRHKRMNAIRKEEGNIESNKAKYAEEKKMLDARYRDGFYIKRESIKTTKARGIDASVLEADYEKYRKKYNEELALLKKKYSIAKDFNKEKNRIVMLDEKDDELRDQISEAVNEITELLERLGYVIRQTIPQ